MKTLLLMALVMQDAPSEASKAIQKVRNSKSYHTKFKAVIEAPGSDPLKIEGESVWVNPGVLYIQYTGSGGDEKRIVRVGSKVWVYHEFLEDWVTAEEMGTPGAGRGVQNPDEVLAIVLKHVDKTKADGGALVLDFKGADIEQVMKEQASQGTFDWKNSRATAKLFVKGDTLQRFTCHAELSSLEENLKGKIVKYNAEVEVLSYDSTTSLQFTVLDEKTKKKVPVAVPEYLKKEIAGYLAKKP
jgi:hypothetical protein